MTVPSQTERMKRLVTTARDIANKLALQGELVIAVELRVEAGKIDRMVKQLEMKNGLQAK